MKLHKGRGGRWYAHCAHAKISLNTKSEAEAKRLAKEANLEGIERAHKARLLSAATVQRLMFGRQVNVHRAFIAWTEHLTMTDLAPLTRYRYEALVRRFIEPYRTRPVQSLDRKAVDAFVNPEDETKVGTRQGRRNALLSFFRFCNASGFVIGNPAELVDVRTHELSHTQMETTRKVPVFDVKLDGLPLFYRIAALLGMRHGLRLSDVAGLHWASLDQPGKLVLFTDKTRTRMEFTLDEETVAALEEVARLDPDYVFPDEYEVLSSPTRRALLSVNFRRHTGVGHHALRHGRATRLAQGGADIASIQREMGHSTPQMTQHYIHNT